MKAPNKDRVTLHFAEVSQVNHSTAEARVRLDELQGMESYWLPVGQYRAGSASTAYWMPEVGERVLCALDESGSAGVILAGIYSLDNPPSANGAGLLAIAVPTLTIDGQVEITGDVSVTGNLSVAGAVEIEGSHTINGKETIVVGSTDTGGDTNNESNQ